MSRIELPRLEDLDEEVAAPLRAVAEKMGHLPHNGLLFTRVRGLGPAMASLAQAVLSPGRVGMELKWLVGHLASRVAGCRYCTAHTAHNAAHQSGVDPARFEQIWEFETSDAFDGAERAALRLAAAAGAVPNEVTDAHFEDLRAHFDDDQILELVAVIALYGFFNRWNETLSVPLEEPARRFGERHLTAGGWTVGRHGPPA